jgi:signal transduction histidine kinase
MTTQDLVVSVVVVSLLLSLLVGFMISFAFLYQKRRFQYQREKQQLQEAYEREILRAQMEIQNQTLRQVGEELHDNVGQLLTLARLHLSQVMEAPDPVHAADKARQANEVLKATIQAVRTLTKTLDGDTVGQFGLVESLHLELDRIQRMGGVEVLLEEKGEARQLPPQAELVLFRMAQEVLNNVLKHAGATRIAVKITHFPAHFSLLIADNGHGFDPDELPQRSLGQTGSGLRNLRRRANLLGGSCALHSRPGEGTRVLIEVPRNG